MEFAVDVFDVVANVINIGVHFIGDFLVGITFEEVFDGGGFVGGEGFFGVRGVLEGAEVLDDAFSDGGAKECAVAFEGRDDSIFEFFEGDVFEEIACSAFSEGLEDAFVIVDNGKHDDFGIRFTLTNERNAIYT